MSHEVNMFALEKQYFSNMKETLYAVRCLKSNEDLILALAGQFKQLSQQIDLLSTV